MSTNLAPIQDRLVEADVAGITIVWADNNGIPRSRTVPVAGLADAAERGAGMSPLFAVFDSHDGISFAHDGLSTASGDIRLLPVMERVTPLAGQPGCAGSAAGPGRRALPV
jgi:glutamine synthetase